MKWLNCCIGFGSDPDCVTTLESSLNAQIKLGSNDTQNLPCTELCVLSLYVLLVKMKHSLLVPKGLTPCSVIPVQE